MVRLKGKAKKHPEAHEFDNALLQLTTLDYMSDGLSVQRKDPSFPADFSSPHEPVSMVPPGDEIPFGEITSKVKKKRKRARTTTRKVQRKRKRGGNTSGRSNKRMRIGYNHWMQKKIKTLGDNLCSIPFSPKKELDLEANKCLLTNLGLWDFVNLEFRQEFVPGLINEIVANYNPKRPIDRASFFNGYPIEVSQSVMASALRLPTKTKLPDQSHTLQCMVLVASEEEALFVEDLIWTYMVLQGPDPQFPIQVMRVIELVRKRKLEQVDWADLVWCMMEKELLKGKDLRDCYYASHMQYLVQYHYPTLFENSDDNDDDDNTGFLEMRSVAHNKGHATENQIMPFVGNENDDLNNGLFLENNSVERIEVAQLSSEVRVEVVEEEDHTANEDEICNVHAEKDLEEGNQYHKYNDFVERLFDELENGESRGTGNKGYCDANSEYQQKEDDGMDNQTDNISWHAMDDISDPHSVETSCQQDGIVITQSKESTESMSDVVVAEDNVLTQVPSIDRNSREHGGEQISVPAEDTTDMEQERTDMMLGCVEKQAEESRQQPVCDVCDSNVSTPPEKKEVSMMAANDADQHSSETTNQQSVVGGEDPISDVLIQENIVSSTEHLCVSDISVAMELKDKDMLRITCQQATDKGDVSELEHWYRPVTKGDEQDAQKGADSGSKIHSDGRNQGVSEAQGMNAAIVLESDSEEETEQQLNLTDGYGDMDMETIPQFYDGNDCNMQSSNIDGCGQEVDFWFPSFKLVPHVQPHPCNEEIIQDLNAKLAHQIQENESYRIQLHQQNENYEIQLQHQHQMRNVEMRRYATQLSLADQLVNDYKRICKERETCFAEHLKKCQQTVEEEAQYMDHPEKKGIVITVAAWEKLKEERRDEEKCNRIQSMFNDFEVGLSGELEEYFRKLDTLLNRVSVCGESIHKLKANVSRS